MAEAELSMISDIFDRSSLLLLLSSSPSIEADPASFLDSYRLVRSCHAKCISTVYAEADLNKGEGVCVDR